jgi:integrase/recombinase XerD
MTPVPEFAGRLEAFFTDRLIRQRRASPHTIGSYRDTFRLLLGVCSAASQEGTVTACD